MSRNGILEKLRDKKEILKSQFGVSRIGYFGSYARGEETESSDIDVLVEFSNPIGWEIVDLHDLLEDLLGKKIDLVSTVALKPQLRDEILSETVFA